MTQRSRAAFRHGPYENYVACVYAPLHQRSTDVALSWPCTTPQPNRGAALQGTMPDSQAGRSSWPRHPFKRVATCWLIRSNRIARLRHGILSVGKNLLWQCEGKGRLLRVERGGLCRAPSGGATVFMAPSNHASNFLTMPPTAQPFGLRGSKAAMIRSGVSGGVIWLCRGQIGIVICSLAEYSKA